MLWKKSITASFLFREKNAAEIFLTPFFDGRLTWEIHDIDNVYEPQYAYLKTDPAEHTAVTLQFYRRPGDIELKFLRKDQFYLVLKGLDKVNFGNKDRDFCLEKVLPASKASMETKIGTGQNAS